MATSTKAQSRISLFVDIDKNSYRRSRAALSSLYDDAENLQFDDKKVKEFIGSVRDAVAEGSDLLSASVTEKFDKSISNLVDDLRTVQKGLIKAIEDEDDVKVEALAKEKALLEREIKNATKQHKDRIKSAKDFSEAFKVDPKTMTAAAEGTTKGFATALNQIKGSDISGLSETLADAAKGGLMDAGKLLASMSQKGSGSEGADGMLMKAAVGLSAAGAAMMVATSAITALVGMLVMADEQAKTLNKTLLEGASMADMAFSQQSFNAANMTSTLDAARKASLNLAFEFRGTSEEFAGILSQLNQAGLSYQEMAKAVSPALTQTRALEKVTKSTFQWSQALGMSTSEVAESMANWSTQFGMDLDAIDENFAAIAGHAMEGGFNVKRFFTAVSQATAGMAIYNVRMEEAAFLLSKTQKILGDTDASGFVQALAQGFSDESMTDRIKRVMIAGGKDAQAIFLGNAERTSESFAKIFAGTALKDPIESAFKSVNASITAKDLTDPKALRETWGKMDAKSRRLVVAQLRQNGDEQSNAASRQLETLSSVLDAQQGGLSAQVRGMAALDMQGKLAFKLQTLGDKRLNEMGVVELAAFESYAGISGSQLEQLMRVESQLMADYELAKKQGKADGKSFNDWIATNREATAEMEKVQKIEDITSHYTRATAENTRSLTSLMQNTIATILNDIYGLMTMIMGDSKEMSKESLDKQTKAIDEIRTQRENATRNLEALDAKLGELDATMSTNGENSEAYQKALAEKQLIQQQQQQQRAAQEYLRAQERQVLQLDPEQVEKMAGSGDLRSAASRTLYDSGEDVEIASRYLDGDAFKKLMDERSAIGQNEAAPFQNMNKTLLGTLAVMETMTSSGTKEMAGLAGLPEGPLKALEDANVNQTKVLQEALLMGTQVSEGQAETQARQKEIMEEELRHNTQAMKDDKKWRESGFYDDSEEASFEALKQYEGWTLANQAGLRGDKRDLAVEEWSTGLTQQGRGVLAEALRSKGMDPMAIGMEGATLPPAQDFIFRPGQPPQRFSPTDTVVGAKPGGPIDKAASGGTSGGGGTVINNIYGGDLTNVYKMVQKAIKASNR